MGKVIETKQCPQCMDSGQDNLAIYEDKSEYCFACGYSGKGIFIPGDIMALPSRCLKEETCRFYDYQVGRFTGMIGRTGKKRVCKNEWVQIANYYDMNGKKMAQKLRTKKKDMTILGNGKALPLFGSWKFQPNEKLFITITEGELDALSIAQVQGCQFPVVSLPNGAQSARKSIESSLPYLLKFKYVVLAFDSDEAGNKAAQECITLFEPGQVRVAVFTAKDANEMLCQGKSRELQEAVYRAKVIEPDHIVSVSSIIDKVLIKPEFGTDYPWDALTNITYGFQLGEIHIIVGPTGCGKTEYIKDIIFHQLDKGMKVGLFSFEQNPDNTVRRLVGAKLSVKLHLPGCDWNEEEIKEEAMKFNDSIYLYDKAGRVDIKDLFNSIRFLAKAKQVQLFVIDNLKALGVSNDFERAEFFMNTLKALIKELNVTVFLISHVAKDKYSQQVYTTTSPQNADAYYSQSAEDRDKNLKLPGMDWESGRMPTLANVEGAGIVTQLADYVFGLARNSVSEEDRESRILRIKPLKCRLDSSKTGCTFKLIYSDGGGR